MLQESTRQQEFSGVSISLKALIDLQIQASELIMPLTKPLSNHWVGGHMSTVRGRGMDFEEVRIYSPGDDVRTMDWRVTARTNTPHVKVYREERERPVLLVVDFTATMLFGTRVAFKSVIAAKVAALLAWATVMLGDRVGAVLFSENEEVDIKPASRTNGVLPILNALSRMTSVSSTEKSAEESKENQLDNVLSRLRRVAPTGSTIFLLSDFESFDDNTHKQLQQLSMRHQVITGLIYDPLECELPDVGICQMTNGSESLLLNSANHDTQHRYKAQFYGKLNNLRDLANSTGQSFFQLATNQPIIPVLQEVLRRTGEVKR